jgi:hypothetical protein
MVLALKPRLPARACLQTMAIFLVYKAVVASGSYMAQHPREEVVAGIGQLLEEAQPYGPSCMPVVAEGTGGSGAAASSHLDSLPARAILPILCSEGAVRWGVIKSPGLHEGFEGQGCARKS